MQPAHRPFRPHVIWAVFKRNFLSYFSNPAGYVFITLFVFVSSAVAFWQPVFFTNNLANLAAEQLDALRAPFFIPAITMTSGLTSGSKGPTSCSSRCRRHDLDVVLGKYLAALGIYTVALAFSLSHCWSSVTWATPTSA